MGSQRAGHDWAVNTFVLELIKVFYLFACIKCLLSPFSRVLLFVNCSPPGSSVHGILQARILERVVIPSSRWSSGYRDQTRVSHVSCIGREVRTQHTHKYSYESHRYLVPKDLPSNTTFQMLITIFLSPESLCPGPSAFWPLFRWVSFKTTQLLRTPGTFFQGSSVRFHIPSLVFTLFDVTLLLEQTIQ